MHQPLAYKFNKKYIIFFSYFVYILPISLIFSRFLSDLIVSLISFYFIYLFIFKKINLFKIDKKISIFFILFWIYISLRSLLAEEILFSFQPSFSYLRFFLFSIFLSFLIFKNKNLLRQIFIVMAFVTIFVSLDLFIQFFFGYDVFLYPIFNEHRLTGPFKNEPIPGSFLARICPVVIALTFFDELKKYKKYNLFFIFFTLFATFITGERTSFFLLFFVYFFYFILNYSKKNFFFFFLFILFITLFTFSSKKNLDRMLIFPICAMNINLYNLVNCPDALKKDRIVYLSGAHEEHITSAIKMFKNNPIFGQGPKMYRIKCKEEIFNKNELSCNTHPHNIVIQLLAETGLIGFAFYIMAFIILIKRILLRMKSLIIKKLNQGRILLFFEIILLQNFLFFLPSGNIFNNFYSIFIYFPLGFYIYFYQKYGR